MALFFQQVFLILNTPLGSLVYNLVLSFSIVAAILIAIFYGENRENTVSRRVMFGLSMLLVARLGLFIVAGLAWQKMVSAEFLLPALSRAVDLLSLLIILWLWVFPLPSRLGDLAVGILSLIVIILISLFLLGPTNKIPDQPINGSQFDQVLQLAAVIIAASGCLMLIFQRPNSWIPGFFMLAVLGVGHLLQLLIASNDGDYSGAVRLAQMISYPLLIIVPLRLSVSRVSSLPGPPLAGNLPNVKGFESFQETTDRNLRAVFLALITETEMSQLERALSEALAHAMQADVCLVGMVEGSGRHLEKWFAYDLVHKQYLPSLSIDAESIPIIMKAFNGDQTLYLRKNSTVPDLSVLASALDLKRVGPLLVRPFRGIDHQPFIDLFLLSPFSDRDWIGTDEMRLDELARPLFVLLDQKIRVSKLENDLENTRQALSVSNDLQHQLEKERDQLREFISLTQTKYGPVSVSEYRSEHEDDERSRLRLQ
jgi:hypothetical protein